jgi:hypothetical protein
MHATTGGALIVTRTSKEKLLAQEPLSIRPVIERYRGAVDMVAGYMERAVALLDDLCAEQDRMMDQLKAILSRRKSLRRTDFDAIFTDVLAQRRRSRETLPALVGGYRANREAVIHDLEELFAADTPQAGASTGAATPTEPPAEAWQLLKERLLDSRDTGEREVVAVLRQVHMEQQELSTALSGLLERAERLKIGDLKTVAKKLAAGDSGESAKLSALLAACEAAGRSAGLQWQKLAG